MVPVQVPGASGRFSWRFVLINLGGCGHVRFQSSAIGSHFPGTFVCQAQVWAVCILVTAAVTLLETRFPISQMSSLRPRLGVEPFVRNHTAGSGGPEEKPRVPRTAGV